MNGQITINRIEETSVVVNWTTTTTINKLEYSINGGSTWTQQSVVAGTGDICRIDGLTPNTEYNIVLRLSYTAGSSTTSSSTNTLTVKTYDYPYIVSVEKTDLIIEDSQTIEVYNPIPRDLKIDMVNIDTSEVLDSILLENTTFSCVAFRPEPDTLYASIPNSQTGNCKYILFAKNNNGTYIPSDIKSNCTYSVDENKARPIFFNFEYKDTNAIVNNILGTNQEFVNNLSNIEVIISSTNKMYARKGATPVKYKVTSNYFPELDYLSGTPYSEDDLVLTLGSLSTEFVENGFISVVAYDSRGLTNIPKTYYPIMYDYEQPRVEVTGSRLNNFENETTIKINGTYSQIIKDGANKNDVILQYRYSEAGTGYFNNWEEITPIKDGNNVTCDDIVLSLDKEKSYIIEVMIIDNFEKFAINSCTIDKGEAIFFISSNKRACYINGQKIVMPFNLPVATVEDTPSYYLLAKLPAKSDSNGTLRINGFLGDRTSSFKAVIDCLIANRGSLNVSGTWYGKSSAFTYLNDIEIYEQANGEHWIYLKVKSSINGGVSLNIEGTDILSDEYSYDYVTTPSGTLVYTINDSTLIDLNTANNYIGDFIKVGLSSKLTVTTTTNTLIPLTRTVEILGSSLVKESNGTVKIGKGVKAVLIVGHAYAYEGGTANKRICINKNTEQLTVTNYRQLPNYGHMEASVMTNVSEGDIISLYYGVETQGSFTVQNYTHGTYMCVTVIK